jgi:hypothetical protein
MASGIVEGSSLFHAMNKLMYKFDELEERIFDAFIVTLPHDACISGTALAFSQPQHERPFPYYFDQYDRFAFDNRSLLASLVSETDKANPGGVTTILPVAMYTLNLVRTSPTNDRTKQHRVLHCLVLQCCLALQSHRAWSKCLRLHVTPPKPICRNLFIGLGNQYRKN